LITEWYEPKERGTWWGILSTCGTLTAGLSQVGFPLLYGVVGQWRNAIQMVSFFPLIMSGTMLFFLKPSPASVGFQRYNVQKTEIRKGADQVLPVITRLKIVLLNPGVQMLSLACFFIYVIRTGVGNWGSLYLHTQKGFSHLSAGSAMFWMEIGGSIGTATGGWISDKVFNGNRGPLNAICAFISGLLALGLLYSESPGVTFVWIFCVGYFLFIPQAVFISSFPLIRLAKELISCFSSFWECK
jgi:OPA family sugar phosphate sensor protein UhpC-like MFS transporter